MAIISILKTALKTLPWKTLATTAMEHAPELYEKAKKHFSKGGDPGTASPAETELSARIVRLEALLLEQETVIRQQSEKTALLENQCATLEARLFSFKIVSGLLFAVAMILLALLLK
ncbi:MAG: hypothetical protein HXX17_16320 [Geobacteraceae bacterium]|nr:hypothetical protein [Geobacteraceae bacterium]